MAQNAVAKISFNLQTSEMSHPYISLVCVFLSGKENKK